MSTESPTKPKFERRRSNAGDLLNKLKIGKGGAEENILNKEDLLKRTMNKSTKSHNEINEEGKAILERLRNAFASKLVKKQKTVEEVKESETNATKQNEAPAPAIGTHLVDQKEEVKTAEKAQATPAKVTFVSE